MHDLRLRCHAEPRFTVYVTVVVCAGLMAVSVFGIPSVSANGVETTACHVNAGYPNIGVCLGWVSAPLQPRP